MTRPGTPPAGGISRLRQLRARVSLVLGSGAALALGQAVLISPAQAQQGVQAEQTRGGTRTDELQQLRRQAKAGEAQAQYLLGRYLQRGEVVLQDYAEAVQWFHRAADQGVVAAQSQLGQIYLYGLGVDQDHNEALHWLQLAAGSGSAEPLFQLANFLEQAPPPLADPAQAAGLYQRAADLGHREAAVSLGVLYQNGIGVAQDLDRARELYEAPAAAGHARALNNLGLVYVRGEGVSQDYGRAAQLFQAAANQGLAVALNNLGTLYENGFGVALDEARAQALYRQAADLGRGDAALINSKRPGALYAADLGPPDLSAAGIDALQRRAQSGDPLAQFQLGWLILQPESGAERGAQLQAVQLLQQAAQAGQAAAMGNLALLYVEGRLLPQDYMLAYMWLVLASTQGQPEAPALAASLASQIPAAQILEAQQRARDWSSTAQR